VTLLSSQPSGTAEPLPATSGPAELLPAASGTAELLPAGTGMDSVTLHVGDLAAMTGYYRDAVGLAVLAEGDGFRVLGRGATPVLVLRHTPGLPRPARGQAGLFHTAILFDDRADLAASVLSTARHPQSQFVGSADHLVSVAFYFTDPEGNGIELYVDRPRQDWRYRGPQVLMDTLHLDAQAFLRTHLTEQAAAGLHDAAAKVGHVHLQVGDIAAAKDFYADALGFATTFEAPGALFVSAGGYHHHLAVNVWNSRGAGPRASTLGLGEVTITVPDRAELDAAAVRMRYRGIAVQDDGRSLSMDDPWLNRVTLACGPTA
jgi:catechol 2,3-dioxygenase